MNNEAVLDVFRSAGALLEGHFILSSGRHSPVFLQKALVFSRPALLSGLCQALAEKIQARFGPVDVIVGPAMGGIIPSYELARHLDARALFVERVQGRFELRRNFTIKPDDRIVIAEDIVTTGLSLREVVATLARLPGRLLGGACIIDRSGGRADTDCDLIALATLDFPDYDPGELPTELRAIPASKPGSRDLV